MKIIGLLSTSLTMIQDPENISSSAQNKIYFEEPTTNQSSKNSMSSFDLSSLHKIISKQNCHICRPFQRYI